MREIRSKEIKDRVFRKADLLNLSAVIIDEFQRAEKSAEDKNEKFHGKMNFSVNCDDDTTYQSEAPDFWREGGIADIKRIRSINMQLHCYSLDQSIDVSLIRGGSVILNKIIVDGLDQHWVNGVFNQLMDILSAVPPQKKSIRYFTNLMLLPASIGYSLAIWLFVAFLITFGGIFVVPGETISSVAFWKFT